MRQDLLSIFADKVAVFTAHAAVQKNADTAYAYEQESNFFWLTGITEPGWQLIVDGFGQRAWLVAPHVSEQQRIFDGSLPYEVVKQVSGIQHIIDHEEARSVLEGLARTHDIVWSLGAHPHTEHFEFVINPAPGILWQQLSTIFDSIKDARDILAKRRAIKSDEEVALIQRAVDVTVAAFSGVHSKLDSLRNEYEIEAEFSYLFTNNGTQGHAYDPIIAAGKNACTLHYGKNADQLPADGLVLLDVGARVGGYAADITRTYALGNPTDRQKAVHAAVERAHHAIIDLLAPGLSVQRYHEQVDEIIKDALRSLDLLRTEEDYRTYFPHAISHGLGVDVHDALGRPKVFQPGMILTVEPGIYIPEEGIGVRIEDDILITDTGNRNLSGALPTSL